MHNYHVTDDVSLIALLTLEMYNILINMVKTNLFSYEPMLTLPYIMTIGNLESIYTEILPSCLMDN